MFLAIAYGYNGKSIKEQEFKTEEEVFNFIQEQKQTDEICEWKPKEVYKLDKQKVTAYITSDFMGCPFEIEGLLLEYGFTNYAQYKKVPYMIMIPKGKRNPIKIIKGYKPFILIVEGFDHNQPPEMLNKREENGLIVGESKYLSFDERYKTDFNKWFNEQNFKVVFDARYNKEVTL